jgi:hypothetical protein
MRRASIVVGLVVVLLGSPLNAAGRAYAAPANGVGLDVLNVNGSGCRQGTTAVALSPDNAAFTVTYSGYLAQAGIGAGRNDGLKDCRINVRVTPPAGYAYTVDTVDYRGFASLAAGATAVEYATYYFNGSTRPPYRTYSFAGQFDDYWQTTDVASSPAYGACGATRVLSIDTQLQVQVGSSDPAATTSFITMDSTDGTVRTTYHLAWRQC